MRLVHAVYPSFKYKEGIMEHIVVEIHISLALEP